MKLSSAHFSRVAENRSAGLQTGCPEGLRPSERSPDFEFWIVAPFVRIAG